jgi:hypothetical protein
MISTQVRYDPNIFNLVIGSWSPTRLILSPQQFSQPRSMVHKRNTVIPAYLEIFCATKRPYLDGNEKKWPPRLTKKFLRHCRSPVNSESELVSGIFSFCAPVQNRRTLSVPNSPDLRCGGWTKLENLTRWSGYYPLTTDR